MSNELIAYAVENAQAAAVIGDGLVRKFARKVDLTFFGGVTLTLPSNAAATSGLQSLATADTGMVALDGGYFDSFDVFSDAVSVIESVVSVCTSFTASFNAVNYLSKVKRFQPTADIVSNEPLLSQIPGDVAKPLSRGIFGVPLLSAPEGTIPNGVVYAPAADTTFVIMRQDISI